MFYENFHIPSDESVTSCRTEKNPNCIKSIEKNLNYIKIPLLKVVLIDSDFFRISTITYALNCLSPCFLFIFFNCLRHGVHFNVVKYSDFIYKQSNRLRWDRRPGKFEQTALSYSRNGWSAVINLLFIAHVDQMKIFITLLFWLKRT